MNNNNNKYFIDMDDIKEIVKNIEEKNNVKLTQSAKTTIREEFENYIRITKNLSSNTLTYDKNSNELSCDGIVISDRNGNLQASFIVDNNGQAIEIFFQDEVYSLIKNSLNHSIETYEKYIANEKLGFANIENNHNLPSEGEISFTNNRTSFHLFGCPKSKDFYKIFNNYLNYCKTNDTDTYNRLTAYKNNNEKEKIDINDFLKTTKGYIDLLNKVATENEFKMYTTDLTDYISDYLNNNIDELTNKQKKDIYNVIDYIMSIIKVNQNLIYSDLRHQLDYINSNVFAQDLKDLLKNDEVKNKIQKIIDNKAYDQLFKFMETYRVDDKVYFSMFNGKLNSIIKENIKASNILETIKIMDNFNIDEFENLAVVNLDSYDNWLTECTNIINKSFGINISADKALKSFKYVDISDAEKLAEINEILIIIKEDCLKNKNEETHKILLEVEKLINHISRKNDINKNTIYSYDQQQQNYIENGLMIDLGRLYITARDNGYKQPVPESVVSAAYNQYKEMLPTVARNIDLNSEMQKHKLDFENDKKMGAMEIITKNIDIALKTSNTIELTNSLKMLYDYIEQNEKTTLFYVAYTYDIINKIMKKYAAKPVSSDFEQIIEKLTNIIKIKPNFLNLDSLNTYKMKLGFDISMNDLYSNETNNKKEYNIANISNDEVDYLLILKELINTESFKEYITSHDTISLNFSKMYSKLKSINSLATISFGDIMFKMGKKDKNSNYTSIVININSAILELITWKTSTRNTILNLMQDKNYNFNNNVPLYYDASSLRSRETAYDEDNCRIISFIPKNITETIKMLNSLNNNMQK